MNLAYSKINPKTNTGVLNPVLSRVNIDPKDTNNKIGLTISTLEGHEVILFSEILYCVSDSNYTTIHCKGGRKVIASKTLKVIESSLIDGGFCRIHRSHLVAIREIRTFTKKEVILQNGKKLEVAQSRRIDLMDRLKDVTAFV